MPSVRLLDSSLATFSYVAVQFAPVAAATDVWQLQCPAGTIAKVRWVEVGGTAAAVRTQPVGLIRRSTNTTGGTSTAPTIGRADTADTPACVIRQWTTLPGALGTTVALLDASTFSLMTGTLIQDRAIFNYEQMNSKPITLGGAGSAEALSTNFAVGGPVNTIATDKLDFEIWWTEQ